MQIGNLTLIIPALYLIAAAVVVLLVGVVAAANPKGKIEHYFSAHYLAPCLTFPALAMAGALIWAWQKYDWTSESMQLFVTKGGAQLTVDPFAMVLSFIAISGTLIVMLLSIDHFGEFQTHKAEYYALLMFATAAASLAAASSDLIAVYLTIEFVSLVSYALAAYTKTDRRSGEAGLKYFLYGAACSAIMIYGMSILFGVAGGNTSFAAIARHFLAGSPDPTLGAATSGAGWVGVMFVLVGLGFKLALVPFQFWAPDVYEGAPTPVTAFLSIVSKAAGLAVLVRFLMVIANPTASPAAVSWYWVLVVLTALSMFWGNLVAIWQRNIKRMLAYSSIAQVGYMMVGVLAGMHVFTRANTGQDAAVRANVLGTDGLPWDLQGVIVFMAAYLLMNLGAFAVVVAVGKRLGSDSIESYAGLMKRSPFYAAALTVFLASLAGIPPTAGFLGKLLVFGGAMKIGVLEAPELIILAALGVVNSVISVYYYFNVVRLMFFAPPAPSAQSDGKVLQGTMAVNVAVVTTLVLTLGLIAFAKPVSELASNAVYAQSNHQTINSVLRQE